MPGSLKSGTRFSRLEEYVMDRLSTALRTRRDVYTLSRQNWFEFREGRPLIFGHLAFSERDHMRNLILYEVRVSADYILKKIRTQIVAAGAGGQAIRGLVAETALDFKSESPARKLFFSAPQKIPFPEGLEERPYVSLDRLSFSLAAELSDAYKNGMSAAGVNASGSEVRVMLYARPSAGVTAGEARAVQDFLQQAVVAIRGFTCAVSREDFGPTFRQIDFYEKNKSIFEMESSDFTAGTVLLMADIYRHADRNKIGVALRALWRITPLESASGDLIPTTVAGTYLSGFTAKAYVEKSAMRPRYPNKTSMQTTPVPETAKEAPALSK
jgi:hypothetical protein